MKTSEQINEIGKALALAQGSFDKACKDAKNPFFKSKYATLENVWNACRPHLSSNGLAVIQAPSFEDQLITVTTRVIHTSGQWIESSLSLKPKSMGPQDCGSAITYAKRYSLGALVGVAEEDDDGNLASHVGGKKKQPPQQPDPAIQKIREENEFKRMFAHMCSENGVHENDVQRKIYNDFINDKVQRKDAAEYIKAKIGVGV